VCRIIEQPGGFLPAFLSHAGDTNQRTTVRLECDDFTCEVVQVAGILARRIVCWVKEGQLLRAGQRIGMIKFGSQVILRVPADLEILVREGQHVRAGEDLVARRASQQPGAPPASRAD
jgi:phosphatidylserine decarboxylase